MNTKVGKWLVVVVLLILSFDHICTFKVRYVQDCTFIIVELTDPLVDPVEGDGKMYIAYNGENHRRTMHWLGRNGWVPPITYTYYVYFPFKDGELISVIDAEVKLLDGTDMHLQDGNRHFMCGGYRAYLPSIFK